MLDPSACGEVHSKIRVNLLFRRQGWQFCLRGISLKATRQLFRVQGTIQRPVTGPRPCEMARSTHNSRPKKTYEQRTLVHRWSLRDLGFIARLLEMASACPGITANQPPYSLVLPCFVQRNPPLASMGGFLRGGSDASCPQSVPGGGDADRHQLAGVCVGGQFRIHHRIEPRILYQSSLQCIPGRSLVA